MLKNLKLFLPLFILLAFSGETLFYILNKTYISNGEKIQYQISNGQIFGFGAIILNIILFKLNKKFFYYFLALTLLLGWVNFFEYGAFRRTISFGINALQIKGQPASMLASFIAYILNYKAVNQFIKISESEKDSKEIEEKKRIDKQEEIEFFRRKFQTYSINDLNEVVEGKHYIDTAKIVAKELLDKYDSKNNSN